MAGEAAVCLFGEVVEVGFGHDAAQADFELVAFAGGVYAVADADEADAPVGEHADGAGGFDLIAAEAADVVDEEDVVGACFCCCEHALILGAVAAAAGDCGVGVFGGCWPAGALAVCADVAQLVVDAGIALGVTAVAGVGGGSHAGAGYGFWRWAVEGGF
ncbi:hypothetical protein JN531_012055 [Flagellatimonas centrodinii]|nr:hypothetical protein [Flagellatimonas centrodinii]ULQ45833.1 hypothetical protein JN531_012055 [Flagellatimonas centrodinii]